MPLPQALAARLAKRGLIKVKPSQAEIGLPIVEKEQVTSLHEEIIAEDYDDTPQEEIKESSEPVTFEKFQGWFSCPNKWNVYHECSAKCIELWKCPKELNKEYSRRRLKMLQKYPLLDHWMEILDVGIGRYYYWNTETNLVSWLPPGHPKCQVSLSAAELRKKMIEERIERMKDENEDDEDMSEEELSSDEEEDLGDQKNSKHSESEAKDSSDDSDNEELRGKRERNRERKVKEKEIMEKEKIKEREERDQERERDKKKRRKVDKADLDPMDPASYSECPRGTWASGLPDRNEARTGVDSTASGPLFQMRPYPNPGAVLRANAAANSSVGPKKPS